MMVRASLKTQILYGAGAVAYGIKDNGFGYFLLMFYGTVVGLDPGLVGTAIFLALIFDAISDPIVGYWSDHTRSRWGRRHPLCMPPQSPWRYPIGCSGTRPIGGKQDSSCICYAWPY